MTVCRLAGSIFCMEFTQDWFVQYMEIWPAIFRNHGWNPDEPKSILEIGCFEGLATCWMLSNLLKHPDSKIVCIDTFEGGEEHLQAGVKMGQVRERFSRNVSKCGRVDSVRVLEERSDEGLMRLLQEKQEPFDFIYVDGSHMAFDVLGDLILSFKLLKSVDFVFAMTTSGKGNRTQGILPRWQSIPLPRLYPGRSRMCR